MRVAAGGVELRECDDFSVDYSAGTLAFRPDLPPAAGAPVTAGFEFDTPVRFDEDQLAVSLDSFFSGSIPKIPIVELKL